MPDDLDVDKLESNAANAKEIILATGTTQDGEVTAMYINKLLSSKYPNLLITRIA